MTDPKDPILDAALDELLGGKTPPDLIAATLAKASAAGSAQVVQLAARPRPFWRAWGGGLAAAAVVVVGGTVFFAATRTMGTDRVAKEAPQVEATSGAEPAVRDGYYSRQPADRPTGGVKIDLPKQDPRIGDNGVLRTVSPPEPAPPPPAPNPPVESPPNPTGFKAHGSNPFVDTEDDRLSTFALEHDTGSYTVARDYLNRGQIPPEEAIRAEEFINYFDYAYDKPTRAPFAIHLEAAPSRYGADLKNCVLVRVGVQARVIDPRERKPAILTIVVDTSGSMNGEHRIGLVKNSLELLVAELREGDKVGIVSFGTEARLVLEHRDAGNKTQILEAIRGLQANGSTNAGAGLAEAYKLASAGYREGYTNRVVLCSDGVANTGVSDTQGLIQTIVENRRKGITLSSLGFGVGHMNDHLLEQLGDKGDGHYAYIDSISEAKRVLVDNLTGALEVVGRDAKMQVEFNPQVVKSYRLVGYVNRDIKDADFRNDEVDGGEIGAGHSATALYEVKLYDNANGPIGTATVRYKTDEEKLANEITAELFTKDVAANWESASNSFRLAGNVAEFAEILGKSFYAKGSTVEDVLKDMESMRFTDERVAELIELMKKAR